MSLSLTWTELPPDLLEPVMQGWLTLAEAAWLWDEYLLTPDGSERELPPELWSAAERLMLLDLEVSPTLH